MSAWQRWLGIAAVLAVGLIAVPVVAVALTVNRLAPIEDGKRLPSGAITVKDGYVSAYVVPIGPHHVVLVDGGMDQESGAIRRVLSDNGFADADVVGILLTHGHPDHTAACAAFPAAKVYAGEADLDLLAGRAASRGPLTRWLGASPSPCASPIGVRDGQVVDIGGKAFRVYAMPGHTAGSVAWYADGVLFLGDAADRSKSGELIPAPWVFSDNRREDERSILALRDRLAREQFPVVALAFAHSGPIEDLTAFARFRL